MLVRPKKKVLTSVWLKNPENTQHSEKILHTNSEKNLEKYSPESRRQNYFFQLWFTDKNDLLYWPASGKASDFKDLAVSQLQYVRDEMEAGVPARHHQHLQSRSAPLKSGPDVLNNSSVNLLNFDTFFLLVFDAKVVSVLFIFSLSQLAALTGVPRSINSELLSNFKWCLSSFASLSCLALGFDACLIFAIFGASWLVFWISCWLVSWIITFGPWWDCWYYELSAGVLIGSLWYSDTLSWYFDTLSYIDSISWYFDR